MSTVTVNERHELGIEGAKKALSQFEGDIAKYGIKIVWAGAQAELKGTGASGDVKVTENSVTVVVKLGLVAKMAGVQPEKLQASIEKRLRSALTGPTLA